MKLRNKFTLLTSLALCAFASFGAFSFFGSPSREVVADGDDNPYGIFEAETQIQNSSLLITVNSASSTDLVETFGFNASSAVTVYGNRSMERNIYFEIIDEAFDGNLVEVEDETAYPTYKVAVFCIQDTKARYSNVVIPRKVYLDGYANFEVVAINSNCFVDAYSNITSVLIPDTIETIYSDAFNDLPDGVEIHAMAASKPEGWADDWCSRPLSDQIHWGHEPTAAEINSMDNYGSSGPRTFSNGESYMLGYHGEGADYHPLVLSYDVFDKESGAFVDHRQTAFPLYNSNNIYDGVGGIATKSFSFNLDVEVGLTETVDPSTFHLHNIFPAEKQEGKWVPLYDKPYFSKPGIRYTHPIDIADFFTFKPTALSAFGDKMMLDVSFNKGIDIYPSLNPLIYKDNEEKIANGTLQIRTLFKQLTSSRYHVFFTNPDGSEGDSVVSLETPIESCHISMDGDYHIGFLFDGSSLGVSLDAIDEIRLENFYVTLDLYNAADDFILVNSSVDTKFGTLCLYNKTRDGAVVGKNNLTLACILTAVIYIVLFAGGSVGLFFYNKNRFKNDEFRRVNPKLFWQTAAKNFVGFGIVTMAVFFIIGRWGFLNNGVVTYNPFDVFVIAFGVVALIFIGFSIKNLVNYIKVSRERRRIMALKLDQDVAEDGTN